GRMRMGQLADAIVFSPSRLTYQVKVLSERGLVKRVKCPEDGRAWQTELTADGRRMFRRASIVHAKGVKGLFTDAVSDEQLSMIRQIFTQVSQKLDLVHEEEVVRRPEDNFHGVSTLREQLFIGYKRLQSRQHQLIAFDV